MGTFCLIGMISFQLTMQNGELASSMIKGAIRVPENGSILDTAKNFIGNNGIHFLTVVQGGDIPGEFRYSSGFVLSSFDTLSIVIFSRENSKIAVNSWISNTANKWTGWRYFTGSATL